MKIATFNLRNLFDEGARQGYDDKTVVTKEFIDKQVTALQTTIRTVAPDILIAEEIGSEKVFQRVAEVDPNYHTFVARPDKRGIANGALFRVPTKSESLDDIVPGFPAFAEGAPDTISASLKRYRPFVILETEYDNKPLHIIGVHFKTSWPMPLRNAAGEGVPFENQTDAGDGVIRALIYKLAQARHIRRLVDDIFLADPEAQIIVTGDFNTTENTEPLNIIMGAFFAQPETQLTNACERIPESKRYSFMGRGWKRLLDHMLVSASVRKKIINIEILNESLADQSASPEDMFAESDHAPVVLTLS